MSFQGRTAIVTGASRGIGKAVALALAQQGASVALIARDGALLDDVAGACSTEGAAKVLPLAVDITDPVAAADAVAQVGQAFGERLDLLANVAGSSLRHARLEQLDDSDWLASFELNLLSAVRLQRLCHPALAAASGAIVNVGSVVASRAAPLGGPYAAAKAGLVALTRSTALEWARDGIRANVVEPGYVDTDFNARLREAGLEERLLARVPTRRAITPEAVARLILFAGDPDNPDLTGDVLRIDGGMTVRL